MISGDRLRTCVPVSGICFSKQCQCQAPDYIAIFVALPADGRLEVKHRGYQETGYRHRAVRQSLFTRLIASGPN
jgi:hypothetical protein